MGTNERKQIINTKTASFPKIGKTNNLGNIVRIKTRQTENLFEDYYFDYYGDAFAAAEAMSEDLGVEVGGFVFPNGTAVIYVYEYATYTSTALPCTTAELAATFHTHPNNPYASEQDIRSHSENHGNADLLILHDGSITAYGFEDGMYLPTKETNDWE